MMRAFAAWVTARRFRLVLLAIASAPLMPVVSAALMVLESGRSSFNAALPSALLCIAGISVLALFAGSNVWVLAAVGGVAALSGLAMGSSLRRAGGLTITFQGTVLAVFLLATAFAVLGPDPNELFAGVTDEVIQVFRANTDVEQQLDVIATWGPLLLGLVEAAALMQLVGALLLGYWWLALLRGDIAFGDEFRELKLGRVLGIPALILMSLGMVLDAPLVQNLTPLALIAFLFQGLAVMHAWAHARRWSNAAISVVYVLLVAPYVLPLFALVLGQGSVLMLITVSGIAVWFALWTVGIVDNVFDMRAPVRPRA